MYFQISSGCIRKVFRYLKKISMADFEVSIEFLEFLDNFFKV